MASRDTQTTVNLGLAVAFTLVIPVVFVIVGALFGWGGAAVLFLALVIGRPLAVAVERRYMIARDLHARRARA